MLLLIFMFLCLMQVKHLIVDFYLQTTEQAKLKGVYGNLIGLSHSLEHFIGTLVVGMLMCFIVTLSPMLILLLAFIDFITHYHIDFVKMHFGCRDISQSKFWQQLGLDQFAHQMVYIGLALVVFYNMLYNFI